MATASPSRPALRLAAAMGAALLAASCASSAAAELSAAAAAGAGAPAAACLAAAGACLDDVPAELVALGLLQHGAGLRSRALDAPTPAPALGPDGDAGQAAPAPSPSALSVTPASAHAEPNGSATLAPAPPSSPAPSSAAPAQAASAVITKAPAPPVGANSTAMPASPARSNNSVSARNASAHRVNSSSTNRTHKSKPRRVVQQTAAEMQGVTKNTEADFDAFFDGLFTNGAITAFCLVSFMLLRLRYPMMYSNNVLNDTAPWKPPETLFGWVRASLGVTIEQVAECAGLDSAMYLEFCNLGMRILLVIGVPMVCIMVPLHFFVGGNAADNRLSRVGMANVVNGHPWLYYVHAAVVWGVCLVTQRALFQAQSKFLQLRFKWLEELSFPRAVTVMVEGIPEEFRSDARLRMFFSKVFGPEKIKDARIVKQTQDLEALVYKRDCVRYAKRRAELQLEKSLKRPTLRISLFGEPIDAIDHHTEELRELERQVTAERTRVLAEAEQVGGVNSSSAFVTFTGRREAEIAKNISYTPDCREWVVSVPPEPSSVLWHDLREPPALEFINHLVGYAGVFGLYLGFTPICIGITNVAYLIDLGPLQPYWESLAPTLGLQVFLSFLPTCMLLLFRCFFTLKAGAWAQQKLQVWYFWFQVFFVILVTAIGNDLLTFVRQVAESPLSIFHLLADQLPSATHFYMNYLVLQMSGHAMCLLRHTQLAKFLAFKSLWSEEEAREMAEPEDQDYYGIGSRSARLAIVMLIGTIYGTLSPSVTVLAFFNFAVCRLVYGYLIVYAETKKPDLGGAFWSTQLKHVWFGNIIYCMLMTGVLAKRAPNMVPMAVAAGSLVYTLWSFLAYLDAFNWEKLSFSELIMKEDSLRCVDSGEVYIQPELRDDA